MIKKRSKISDYAYEDKKLSIAIMSSYVVLTIQYFVLVFFDIIGTTAASRIQMFSKIIVGITFFFAFPIVIKRSKILISGVYFITFFIILSNFLFFPENSDYLKSIVSPILFMNIPTLVYVYSIYDLKILKNIMKKASFVVFFFGTAISALSIVGRVSVGSYSMSLSYYMLLPIVMFLDDLLENFSFRYLLLSLISVLVVLALGSRGAIFCLIIFIILKFFRPNQRLSRKKFLKYTNIIGITFLFLLNLEDIIELLYFFFLKLGINSRTLMLFLREDINLSGRDQLYKATINAISKKPILGHGLAGDRKILDGFYVHNIFLEIILNFGIIFGLLLGMVLIIIIIKVILSRNCKLYDMGIIWFSLGFIHLMITGSYLIDMKFWIFLGVFINIIKHKMEFSNNELEDT